MTQETKKRCSSLESIVEYEDILIDILVRVPARPLVRFKCVSKRWLFLISDPTFCHHHGLRNPRPSISAFYTPYSGNHFYMLNVSNCGNHNNPLHFVDNDIEIVQSCNGLFLCRLQDPYGCKPTTASSLVYYVLNPTTNKFRLLTPPSAAAATSTDRRIFAYALAFDPSKSPHYKVVFLWFANEPLSGGGQRYYRVEIYSSQTRSWRLLDSSFIYHRGFVYQRGVYHNGAVHWASLSCGMTYYHIDEERVGLVYGLPMDNHEIHALQWASLYYGLLTFRHFGESHDGTRLHLIDIPRSFSRPLLFRTNLKVFEMGKDYSAWSVKYIVDMNPLCAAFPDFLKYRFVVLSFAAASEENEKDEDSSALLQLYVHGKVVNYNLRDNTFKSSDVTIKGSNAHSSFSIHKTNFHYVEILAGV